jgi:hypothetical protein
LHTYRYFMKKFLLITSVFVALVIIGSYLFIPAKIHFRKSMYVKTSPNSATRFLLDEKAWHNWWPSKQLNAKDSVFFYKTFEYLVNWKMISGDSIQIKTNNGQINSLINIIPINKDSTGFQWEGESIAEKNIFKRVRNYFTQKKIQNNANEIFISLKNYLENEENVYGIKIEHKMVVDTLLISTKKNFSNYPTTVEVYEMINNLTQYINLNNVTQTNPPMLHVVQDSGMFKTMVALPINKLIMNTDKFVIKKMIAGKILIAETKGGSANAEASIKKLELYMDDYHIMSPAISFQSLVTDRSKESDSTKWVTKLYYPIM